MMLRLGSRNKRKGLIRLVYYTVISSIGMIISIILEIYRIGSTK